MTHEESGAQFAAAQHLKTVELQAIAIKAKDDEIARLGIVVADQRATIAGMVDPAAPSEQAEPVGYKWAPIEPTEIMLAIADEDKGSTLTDPRAYARALYKEMLALCFTAPVPAAAPAAPLPALKNGFLYQDGLYIKAVLYTDVINEQQVCRDDLWLATTEALNKLAEGPAAPVQAAPLPELTGPSVGDDRVFERMMVQWWIARESGGGVDEYRAIISHIDRRSAASPSPAPAPTEPQQTFPLEQAPPNSLPNWDECALRVENSDFIAKRMAEGGYGAEADSKLATQLHRFIFEYDDADSFRSAWFMHRLELTIEEAKRMGGITSKESAETAAPGASTEDKQ